MYGLTIFVGGAVDGRNAEDAQEADAFLEKLREMVCDHNGEHGVIELSIKVYNGTVSQAVDDDDEADDEEVLLRHLFAALDEKAARDGRRCSCDTCKATSQIRESYENGKITSGEAIAQIKEFSARRQVSAEEKFAAFRADELTP